MVEIEDPVLVEATAPYGHVEAVEAVLKRNGIEVGVEAGVERKSAELLPWLIRIVVEGTIYELIKSLGIAGVKAMFRELRDAREGAGNGKGSVTLTDSEHTNVVLSHLLPDEAIDALEDLDWSERRGDYLVWNAERREWYDPTKRD